MLEGADAALLELNPIDQGAEAIAQFRAVLKLLSFGIRSRERRLQVVNRHFRVLQGGGDRWPISQHAADSGCDYRFDLERRQPPASVCAPRRAATGAGGR